MAFAQANADNTPAIPYAIAQAKGDKFPNFEQLLGQLPTKKQMLRHLPTKKQMLFAVADGGQLPKNLGKMHTL